MCCMPDTEQQILRARGVCCLTPRERPSPPLPLAVDKSTLRRAESATEIPRGPCVPSTLATCCVAPAC
jgi:hypothetical protein